MKLFANKIYFLVSLDDDTAAIGIYNDIVARRMAYLKLSSEYCIIDSGTTLIWQLKKIEIEAKNNGIIPHLHFECHGSKDGLLLNNGLRFNWESLTSLVTRINGYTKNNLVVSMALCNGGFFNIELLNMLDQSKNKIVRSPAYVILGPPQKIGEGLLENGFSSFFNEYLKEQNLSKGLKKLQKSFPGTYDIASCEMVFQSFISNHVKNYYEQVFKDKYSLRRKMDSLAKTYFNKTKQNLNKVQWQELYNHITDKETYLKKYNEMRKNYYWIDVYPENEKRFATIELENWDDTVTNKFTLVLNGKK